LATTTATTTAITTITITITGAGGMDIAGRTVTGTIRLTSRHAGGPVRVPFFWPPTEPQMTQTSWPRSRFNHFLGGDVSFRLSLFAPGVAAAGCKCVADGVDAWPFGQVSVPLVLVLAVVRLWPRYSIGVSGAGVAAAATRAVGAEWALLPRED
jgi:hypothetical protein